MSDVDAARRLRIDKFYEDARARADSAEGIASATIRGVVLLNGAGLALLFSGLGLDVADGSVVALDLAGAEDAAGHFIAGAVWGVAAVATFAVSVFARSYFEFFSAEKEYGALGDGAHFGEAKGLRNAAWQRYAAIAYVIAGIAAVACAGMGVFGFYRGASDAIEALGQAAAAMSTSLPV